MMMMRKASIILRQSGLPSRLREGSSPGSPRVVSLRDGSFPISRGIGIGYSGKINGHQSIRVSVDTYRDVNFAVDLSVPALNEIAFLDQLSSVAVRRC